MAVAEIVIDIRGLVFIVLNTHRKVESLSFIVSCVIFFSPPLLGFSSALFFQ